MSVKYEIQILDALSNQLDHVVDWISLDYVRAVNAVGTLKLVLDGDYNTDLLKLDGRILVWRNVDGRSYIDTDTAWLIREVDDILDDKGAKVIEVTAFSANELLTRRVIAYDAGTAQASASSEAVDDLMKRVVIQNLGACAAGTQRDISTYLSVAACTTQGPSTNGDFARDNVFKLFQDFCKDAYEGGSAVYFDVVTPDYDSLEFRTYRDYRGIDHTFPDGITPVVLSPERGNLKDIVRSYDYTKEITYVYAGGQGLKTGREVQTASSSERLNQSPFNRRESFANATSSSEAGVVQDAADAALRAGRPVRSFSGDIESEAPGVKYGVHWAWGDKVTAQYKDVSVDCTVDAIKVSVDKGKEQIKVALRVEED